MTNMTIKTITENGNIRYTENLLDLMRQVKEYTMHIGPRAWKELNNITINGQHVSYRALYEAETMVNGQYKQDDSMGFMELLNLNAELNIAMRHGL